MEELRLFKVANVVAKHAGIDSKYIKEKSRKRENATARLCFYYIAYKHCGFSCQEIGKNIGRDRTVVFLGTRKFEKMLNENEGALILYNTALDEIFSRFNLTGITLTDVKALELAMKYIKGMIKIYGINVDEVINELKRIG